MSTYRIQRGDTLSALARRFRTSVSRLAKANGIRNPNLIIAGRTLRVGADSFQPAGRRSGAAAPRGPGAAGAPGPSGPAPKGQVGEWIQQAIRVLEAHGIPASKMNPRDIALIIQHESGGNPNAQNNWDSNARKGTPSIGLMQTIGPTFDAHKLPGHGNIRNPVDNIIAGVRYAIARYGSVSNVPGVRGVNSGGRYVGY